MAYLSFSFGQLNRWQPGSLFFHQPNKLSKRYDTRLDFRVNDIVPVTGRVVTANETTPFLPEFRLDGILLRRFLYDVFARGALANLCVICTDTQVLSFSKHDDFSL